MKYIFVTGGVVSSLGKGLTAAALGTLLEHRGLKVVLQKFDPYLNVRPRHDEPLPARRSLRAGGRRRDRPRPRPLRAFHLGQAHAQKQPHHRPDLRGGAGQGAPRRLPRQDGAGHPARHGRDQAAHPAGWTIPGLRRGHHRDRRHHGRHRGPAVPRGHPPIRTRGRTRQRALHARDAGAVHQGRGRAEDEADAAERGETARDRYPAAHPDLPLRAFARPRGALQAFDVLQRPPRP